MSLINVYREQGIQLEKRILKRLSERMGVEKKERDIRDSPIVGLFILECGDGIGQNKPSFSLLKLQDNERCI